MGEDDDYQSAKYNRTGTLAGTPVDIYAYDVRYESDATLFFVKKGTGQLLRREVYDRDEGYAFREAYDMSDGYSPDPSPDAFHVHHSQYNGTCINMTDIYSYAAPTMDDAGPTKLMHAKTASTRGTRDAARAAAAARDATPVNEPARVEAVATAAARAGWIGGVNARFDGVTVGEARRMLGTFLQPMTRLSSTVEEGEEEGKREEADDVPASFDARTHWPHCVHPIRDQKVCGSCWAFGAAESLSDRMCIAKGGGASSSSPVLSPEMLVDCDKGDSGCNGGFLDHAWLYMQSHGLVTEACDPYVAGCDPTSPFGPKCETRCDAANATCADGSAYVLTKAARVRGVAPRVSAIQREIMRAGPVEAAIWVMSDFMHYKGGVYKRTDDSQFQGGHAIKIVGWGEDKGVKYWSVANSWGTTWGEKGYFRIRRGVDELAIESTVATGDFRDK